MTQKEITRLRVINQTIDKVITIKEAAELLGLSERQVMRLKGGVSKHGPAFIIHKNRGRKPQHTLPDEMRMKIVELKQTKYQEANFSHFVELLEEHDGIKVSYTCAYRILTQAFCSRVLKSSALSFKLIVYMISSIQCFCQLHYNG